MKKRTWLHTSRKGKKHVYEKVEVEEYSIKEFDKMYNNHWYGKKKVRKGGRVSEARNFREKRR